MVPRPVNPVWSFCHTCPTGTPCRSSSMAVVWLRGGVPPISLRQQMCPSLVLLRFPQANKLI